MTDACRYHHKGDGSWWAYDGYGIELCRVCEKCEREKMRKYRHDIHTRYECDEPIEPEDY
jgi:hypothetical protein